MVVGSTLLIVGVLIVSIWVMIEVKRLKHKLFAIALIALILFSYLSATLIFRGEEIDYKTPSGIMDASKIYFSWLISISGNFIEITGNAIKMDWGVPENESPKKVADKNILADLVG